MATLWQAAAGGTGLHPDVEAFLSSLSVDSRLLGEDIECSIAHAAMLGRQGILRPEESASLCAALGLMLAEAKEGKLAIDPDSEDIHSFIEAELTKRLGEAGKAVHAGRSRNDQVAVAFRLHILRAFDGAGEALLDALDSILTLASEHRATIMPGYTHLQRAQALTLAHHLLAWCAALERDYSRLRDGRERANECPLGAGALAGSGLPTDRESVAQALGFARPSRNTMDAVADRDACVDFAAACSNIMVHLSRACEDIALWVSTEYGFMALTDAASTGSSIMPQKRNPDPAELIRGKTARVFGALQALLVMQKGLPYAYNRDLQEDKEMFFDIEDTVKGALRAFAVLVASLRPNVEKMRRAVDSGFLEATDIAEYLVIEGLPFRTAYQAAKALVGLSLATGRRFAEIPEAAILASHDAFRSFAFDREAFVAYLEPEACVARRRQVGGPAPERTAEEIARLRAFLAKVRGASGSP